MLALRCGADGPAVLVDRGFLPAPDAVTANAQGLEEPGEVTVRGIALPVPSGGGKPIEHGGRTTWRRLDLPALRYAARIHAKLNTSEHAPYDTSRPSHRPYPTSRSKKHCQASREPLHRARARPVPWHRGDDAAALFAE